MVTEEQKNQFVLLTKSITKLPITIYASPYGEDTESFAVQVREMFTRAKFPIPAHGDTMGINTDLIIHFGRKIAGANRPPPLFILYSKAPAASNFVEKAPMDFESDGNEEFRPKVNTNDLHMVFSAISFCLDKVGISNDWVSAMHGGVAEGQYVIFVPPKNL